MKKIICVLICVVILCSVFVPVGAIEPDGTESVNNSTEPTTETTIQAEEVTTEPQSETSEYTKATETEATIPTQESTATEPTTEVTQPTTEPLTIPDTSIVLKSSSVTLYVGAYATIEPVIKNGRGSTEYITSNDKVASINQAGKIRAEKKGTALITVRNNGALATFTVKVRNPKLNHKTLSLRTKKVSGHKKSMKLSIVGKVKGETATFKSNNSKVATVSRGGKVTAKSVGRTTVKVKYMNKTYKCKVVVKKPTEFERFVKYTVVFKKKKQSLTKNVGTPGTYIDDLIEFETENNLSKLFHKGFNVNKLNRWSSKIESIVGKVKYSLSDKTVARIKDGVILPLKKGTTTLKAAYGDNTITIPINITRNSEISYKSNKAKVVYNSKETYNALKDSFYNYIIKGEYPKYKYLAGCFDTTYKKLYDTLHKYSNFPEEIDEGSNFNFYLDNAQADSPCLLYDVIVDSKIEKDWQNNDFNSYSFVIEIDTDKIDWYKKIYNLAQGIFKETNIFDFNNSYEQIVVLATWLYPKQNYGTYLDEVKLQSSEYEVLKGFGGVCGDWAQTTVYLCSLLSIPCSYADYEGIPGKEPGHLWTIVKFNGKWYHVDLLWGELLLGTDSIKELKYHYPFTTDYDPDNPYSICCCREPDFVSDSDYSTADRDCFNKLLVTFVTSEGEYNYKIEYTPEFFNKVFGWNGVEQIDLKTLEREYIN